MPKRKDGQSLYFVEALETGLLKKTFMVWADNEDEAISQCKGGETDWVTREIMDPNDSDADEWLELISIREIPDAQV